CGPSSCSNGIEDGTESDIDCGGSCPTKCGLHRACAVGADCTSGTCTLGVCR
ncbi:MAG: peptidase, partial [Myxococcaceae bacterium]|nr:peptidase [Myxococcaceae bacterium]